MGDLSISNCNKCGSKCHSCKCKPHSPSHAVADNVMHPMLARRLPQPPAQDQAPAEPESTATTNATEDLVRFVKITNEIKRYEAEMNALTRERDASIEAVGWVSKSLQQLAPNSSELNVPKLEPPQSREDNLEVESPAPPVQHMQMEEPEPEPPKPKPLPKKVKAVKKKKVKPSEAFLRLTQTAKPKSTARSAAR